MVTKIGSLPPHPACEICSSRFHSTDPPNPRYVRDREGGPNEWLKCKNSHAFAASWRPSCATPGCAAGAANRHAAAQWSLGQRGGNVRVMFLSTRSQEKLLHSAAAALVALGYAISSSQQQTPHCSLIDSLPWAYLGKNHPRT
jgi:hypothetical protein